MDGFSIAFAADVMPTERNIEGFKNKIGGVVEEKLLEKWKGYDYRFFNIEGPLFDGDGKVYKSGPCIKAPRDCVKGILELNPTAVTLCNNHIMDFGIEGYKSTKKALEEKGIPYFGVGDTIESVKKYYTIECNGQKIVVYTCAESEFSNAGIDVAGSNPFDILDTFDDIKGIREKEDCDFLVVLYHGGKEHYRYCSPILQKTFRKMSEYGANLVIAQHTHCAGCYEEYNGSTLVYGQGNFIFDNQDNELWNNNIIVELDYDTDGYHVSYVPIVKDKGIVRLARSDEASRIISGFMERSIQIKDHKFVKDSWDAFCNTIMDEYLCYMFGFSKPVRGMVKFFGYNWVRKFYYNIETALVYNLIRCEPHREVVLSIFEQLTDKYRNEVWSRKK